jgi:peptide/nickel transport system substrate-binding protein
VERLIGSEAFPNGSAIELKGPRKLDAAGRLLAESGYAGQPVTCMAAQDLPITTPGTT